MCSKFKHAALLVSALTIISGVAITPSVAEYAFRHKIPLIQGTIPGDGGNGEPSGGEPSDGETPQSPTSVACGEDAGTNFSCAPYEEKVRGEEPIPGGPINITMITGPTVPTADLTNFRLQCFTATGGYGNYIYTANMYLPPEMVDWVRTVDIVPFDQVNSPNENVYPLKFIYGLGVESRWDENPGEFSQFLEVEGTSNLCVRVVLDPDRIEQLKALENGPELDDLEIVLTVNDYSEIKVNGNNQIDAFGPPPDQEKAIQLNLDPLLVFVYTEEPPINDDPSLFGVSFATNDVRTSRWPSGPPIPTSMNVTTYNHNKNANFYYQCYEYSGGFDNDQYSYWLKEPFKYYEDGRPSWVEWYDIVPRDSLYTSPSPNSYSGENVYTDRKSWPINIDARSSINEVCIRIKEVDDNTSNTPFEFTFYTTQYNVDPDDYNHVTHEMVVTPLLVAPTP